MQVSRGEEHVDGSPDLSADPQYAGAHVGHQAAGGGKATTTPAA